MADTISILFAEDHKVLRQALIPLLEHYGVDTAGEAESGEELLLLLETISPDVILLDLQMKSMNGSEAFEKIRKLYPKLKVIIFSSHNDPMLINHFHAKGAYAYLSKNDEVEHIVETIRMVHDGIVIFKDLSSEPDDLKFSARETEVIPLIVEGRSNKEIAEELNINHKTVEAHKKRLFKKTKTQSAVSFVGYLFKRGLHFLK
jgi:two-component system, NarL family, nitrate/nitrite response regulator NarL